MYTVYSYFSEAAMRVVLQKKLHKNFAIFTEKYLCWSQLLKSSLKRDSTHWCFPVINANFLRTSVLKYAQAASENLSGAAILIFRRYFRSSSLSAFYKVGVLKKSVKFLGNTYARVADLYPEITYITDILE